MHYNNEHGLSPIQLWNRGLLSGSDEVQSEICKGLEVDDDYGLDSYLGSVHCTEDEHINIVEIPEIEVELNDFQFHYIQENFNPLQTSDQDGLDINIQLKNYIATAIQ